MSLLRADITNPITDKKWGHLKSLESHIKILNDRKTLKASLEAEVSAFDAIISGIPEEAAINGSAFIVRARALYTRLIENETLGVAAERLSLNDLNAVVQGDADFDATEKQEFLDAKTNEV